MKGVGNVTKMVKLC